MLHTCFLLFTTYPSSEVPPKETDPLTTSDKYKWREIQGIRYFARINIWDIRKLQGRDWDMLAVNKQDLFRAHFSLCTLFTVKVNGAAGF